MKKRFLIILFILFSASAGASRDTFDFALSLYQDGDYYRSVSEFKRFLYYYPADRRVDDACLYIVKGLFQAGQYAQAAAETLSLRTKVRGATNRGFMDLYLYRNYVFSGRVKEARKGLEQIRNAKTVRPVREQACHDLIWTDVFESLWRPAYDRAGRCAEEIRDTALRNRTAALRSDLEKALAFSYLSPGLALSFSAIVPGLGQVYCKRPGDGVVAFVLISLLTYGAVYHYRNGPEGMFYGFAVLDGIFYLGNIYTAYGSAKKHNRALDREFRINLIRTHY